MKMPGDIEILSEISDCSMLEETNEDSIKSYRRFVIQVPKNSELKLDEFRTALVNVVAGGGA